MIRHYFLAAWRSLVKNRTFTLIHLFGLTLALTTCMLLGVYLMNEFRFDHFHSKADRICRLNVDLIMPGQQLELALASGAMAPAMAADFPEVENFVRLAMPGRDLTVRQGNLAYFEKNILYADSTFFDLFDFELLEGDAKKALGRPDQVVITKKLAAKYFGDADPIGAELTIEGHPYTVSGMAADPPGNSQIGFDALISWATWARERPPAETNWGWTSAPTYILLAENTDYKAVNEKLAGWLKTRMPEEQQGEEMKLSLEFLLAIHFNPPLLGELKPKGNRKQLLLLSLTGVFILFMALFNYVNLATALYAGRTREIGVRKTFGARGRQISAQFLSESTLLAAASIACSVLAAKLMLPWFGRLTGHELTLDFLSPAGFGLVLSGALLLIGLLAGAYPSVVVSRWTLIRLFHGDRVEMGGITLRRLLTGTQFIISIGLAISTFVIWRQYAFLNRQGLGFDREEKMVINFGGTTQLPLSVDALKTELQKIPGVRSVTFSSHVPTEYAHGVYTAVQDINGEERSAEMELTLADAGFLNVYGLDLIAGRNFSGELATDTTSSLILNETAVQQLGFAAPEDIIGRRFRQWDWSGTVIGVVRDYHQHSLRDRISPVTFQMHPDLFEKVTVQYKAANLPAFVQQVQQSWTAATAGLPFQFTFMDERLALQYDAERRFSSIFTAFTLLAVFISCIGLFGLTAIAVSRRVREIGIRKVLGATPGSIVALFSRDFIRLVLIAVIVAAPPAWYFTQNWLRDFAYRIDLPVWSFALIALGAGAIAGLITLATVGLQGIAAAHANPVDSLKNE
ncbi:MAG TPA: ABC transporter permease [Flavilitoribacter sp.]|nr:ABC transporter permease [Flavilitoribacter sp.]